MTTKSIIKNIDILSKVIVATLYYEFERFKAVDPNNTAFHLQFLEEEMSRVHDLKQANNIKELRKVYNRVIKVPTLSGDINFIEYVKRKTNIDIDLFGNIDERVNEIMKQGFIATKKEHEDTRIVISLN